MIANYELQCEMRTVALDQFKQIVVKLFPGDSFEDREMRFDMTENINSIMVSKCLCWSVPKIRFLQDWEKHELRGFHQNLKEQEVLEKLKDRTSAYLTFDLAMKVEITTN